MAVASLIISIIALGFTGWNMAYRWRADRRERWWARITWALDRFSDDTASLRDRELAWDLLIFHITEGPTKRKADDQALLDALDTYLDGVEDDTYTDYDEDSTSKE
ncbi:MAG: hypothetical protein ACTHYO_16660 [Micrococcaceae bacterium]